LKFNWKTTSDSGLMVHPPSCLHRNHVDETKIVFPCDTRGKCSFANVQSKFTCFKYNFIEPTSRIWLIISAATLLAGSHVEFIATAGFPAILSISNLLIHARIGLGWSQESADAQKKKPRYIMQSGMHVSAKQS
jgi:hypothetical protein